MPELKHNFLKGRMNKDLDERLVPNGEYRDALNVEVSTSEGSDVGAVQTTMGNINLSEFDIGPLSGGFCVGSIADEKNDVVTTILEMQNDLARIIERATRNGLEKREHIADAIAAMRESLALLNYDRRTEVRRMSERRGVDGRRVAKRGPYVADIGRGNPQGWPAGGHLGAPAHRAAAGDHPPRDRAVRAGEEHPRQGQEEDGRHPAQLLPWREDPGHPGRDGPGRGRQRSQ